MTKTKTLMMTIKVTMAMIVFARMTKTKTMIMTIKVTMTMVVFACACFSLWNA